MATGSTLSDRPPGDRSLLLDDLMQALGTTGDDDHFAALLGQAGSVALPSLDEEEPEQHFDWVLVRSRGVELGFADAAYLAGMPRAFWRDRGLTLCQLTFYSGGRQGVSAYAGELPYGLQMSDSRSTVRAKLAAHEATRRSHVTDCWSLGGHRVVVAYKPGGQGLDSVHIKCPLVPLDERLRRQPAIDAAAWPGLFGQAADSAQLQGALAPLDVPARIEEEDDSREVEFLEECGLTLYFEQARRLRTVAGNGRGAGLVLGAVKFHRDRDMQARGYRGPLPFGLSLDDSPEVLAAKVGAPPERQDDGPMTGRMLWHLDKVSLQVLCSTIENHLFRVMLMAPGYWHELGEAA
jgi:hypothetical protein